MVKEEQELLNLKLDFISIGMCKGNMVHYNDRVKQYIALNPRGNYSIYGAIFLMPDYDVKRDILTSYYNSTTGLYGLTTAQSFFNFETLKVKPIKINKLSDLKSCKYKVGDAFDCVVPVVNTGNPRVNKYVTAKNNLLRTYHRHKRIDTNNFIQMIKENQKEND